MSIFQEYFGGFITRGRMLTGLLYKHQPIESICQTIDVYFLPVDGNNTLIKDSENEGIKIIDIDSAGSSSKRKWNNEEPSDIVKLQ